RRTARVTSARASRLAAATSPEETTLFSAAKLRSGWNRYPNRPYSLKTMPSRLRISVVRASRPAPVPASGIAAGSTGDAFAAPPPPADAVAPSTAATTAEQRSEVRATHLILDE